MTTSATVTFEPAPRLASDEPAAPLPWDLAGFEAALGPAERPGRSIRGGPRQLRRLAETQPDRPYERFGVTPLSPLIGAEISGIDLGVPMDPELKDELHRAWLEWKGLFFRDQGITADQQGAVGPVWGGPGTTRPGPAPGGGGVEGAVLPRPVDHRRPAGRVRPRLGGPGTAAAGPGRG